jgi:hypothetical protein
VYDFGYANNPVYWWMCLLVLALRLCRYQNVSSVDPDMIKLYKVLNPSIMTGTYYKEHSDILASDQIAKLQVLVAAVVGVFTWVPYWDTFDLFGAQASRSVLILYMISTFGVFYVAIMCLRHYLITVPLAFLMAHFFLIA